MKVNSDVTPDERPQVVRKLDKIIASEHIQRRGPDDIPGQLRRVYPDEIQYPSPPKVANMCMVMNTRHPLRIPCC